MAAAEGNIELKKNTFIELPYVHISDRNLLNTKNSSV
jgi:hypothetical protein